MLFNIVKDRKRNTVISSRLTFDIDFSSLWGLCIFICFPCLLYIFDYTVNYCVIFFSGISFDKTVFFFIQFDRSLVFFTGSVLKLYHHPNITKHNNGMTHRSIILCLCKHSYVPEMGLVGLVPHPVKSNAF